MGIGGLGALVTVPGRRGMVTATIPVGAASAAALAASATLGDAGVRNRPCEAPDICPKQVRFDFEEPVLLSSGHSANRMTVGQMRDHIPAGRPAEAGLAP